MTDETNLMSLPDLKRLLERMSAREDWAKDDIFEAYLGSHASSDKEKLIHFMLDRVDITVEVLAWLKSRTAISLLDELGISKQWLAALVDKLDDVASGKGKDVMLERLAVMAKARMLKKLYAPERVERVYQALNELNYREI